MIAINLGSFSRQEYLVVTDYCTKMLIVCQISTGQHNAKKIMSLFKEMIAKHGNPETLCMPTPLLQSSPMNGPSYMRQATCVLLTPV